MTSLTFHKPEDVIDAFVADQISRDEIEFILNSPCFGLDRFEYVDCLLKADDLKAATVSHCQREHEAAYGGRL